MKKSFIFWFLPLCMLLMMVGCEKCVVPTVTTSAVSTITQTTAISGGEVTFDGGSAITARGICWNTSATPTTANSKTSDGTGLGSYPSSLTSLTAATTYFVRAYATNSEGTGYGNEITFTTTANFSSLTTTAVSAITSSTATSGGNITADGGAAVTARGVCWGTTTNPTISNSKTSDGVGTGSYTSLLTLLTANTTYYVKAYATNSAGTSYGSEVTFKTSSLTVTDIDANVYKTVIIGTQVWMAENLKTTKYRNGDLIGTTSPATANISGITNPKYQWSYGGNENNVATYGRLYTWFTVTDSRGVCPTGWHLPSDAEWDILSAYLGVNAGGKMKETGSTHWGSPNVGATNESGFTALSAGSLVGGVFYDLGGAGGGWWSSSQYSADLAWYRACGVTHADLYKSYTSKQTGWSVRCLKD